MAVLFAMIIIIPLVGAQNNTSDVIALNHLNIHFENKNITNFIAYDITSKVNLSSYDIQKPEELLIPTPVKKFDVVTIDYTLFNDQLKSGKGITISIGGKDYPAELSRMNFENISDGIDSYHGSFSGVKNSDILFTTGEKVLIGRITLENETFWIIPVEPRPRTELSQSPLHIIYNSKDVENVKFTIDNGTVKINSEVSPSLSQSKLSNLQLTPPDQSVTVDILVVTDSAFYNNSVWVVTAQNIIAEANWVLSNSDIRVILRPQYDASRRNQFYSYNKPLELFLSVYPNSFLDSVGADIALYLGGYDIPYPNLNWEAQGMSWGFDSYPELRRYSWAQMVYDDPGYTATPHGQQVISIHEIGHLFDADHNDATGLPQYAKAATFGIVPFDKKTVVWKDYSETASLTAFSSDLYQYQVFYLGYSQWYLMGDINHDNSRRISETRDIVAGYAQNDKIGVFRNGVWYLRDSNTNGPADLTFAFGQSGDKPVAGDWNGDGIDTIGVFRNGMFYLRNSNTGGIADLTFIFGQAGDVPVIGDWNGDGIDTIGVFRNGTFYLRNSNTGGNADITFGYGMASDIPVVGDWA